MKLKLKGDFCLLITTLVIVTFGILMVYSSSWYSALNDYGDKFYFMKKQIVGVAIGLVGLVIFSFIDYHKLQKFKYLSLILSVVMLALVFVPFLSFENYGAKRWIKILGVTIQPSEFAKLGYALFIAGYVAKNPSRVKTFLGILPILLGGGVICLLIMLEPNMSITVCVGSLMLVMLFVSGAKLKHIILVLLPILVALPLLIILEPYRLNRLSAFLNPWASPKGEGYQLLQSLYALGSGGFFGVGFLKSRQKFEFLPFAESDFIMSVIGEEFGFFGLILLFVAFGIIIYRGIVIGLKSKDMFGLLLSVGIVAIIGLQVIVNALVVTGSIPPTGLPLPLISSGNTSLIVSLSSIGILFNISKNCEKKKVKE